MIKIASILAAILAVAVSAPFTAQAQPKYPDKPIKLLVPFPPGAVTDIVARVLAQGLGEELQGTVIIDNKAGANGKIAAEQMVRAPADGYTLLFNTSSLVLVPSMVTRPGYDPIRDLAPVAMVSSTPLVFIVPQTFPANTLQEFIAYAKANPGKLAYGSGGVGNGTHLGAQVFFDSVGIKALHVPYKGGALAITDLIGDRIQFYAGSPASTLPFIKDKRVKVLAVTSLKRIAVLPDVPTVNEVALPNFEVGLWQGIMAPAKTPPQLVNRLHAALTKVMQRPEFKARMDAEGALTMNMTSQEYGAYLKVELDRWAQVIRNAGITPE